MISGSFFVANSQPIVTGISLFPSCFNGKNNGKKHAAGPVKRKFDVDKAAADKVSLLLCGRTYTRT
jgi:hypothetical protein